MLRNVFSAHYTFVAEAHVTIFDNAMSSLVQLRRFLLREIRFSTTPCRKNYLTSFYVINHLCNFCEEEPKFEVIFLLHFWH